MSRGNDPIGEALGFGIRVTFWLLKLAWKLTFGLVGAAIGLGMKSAESDPVVQIRSQQAGSVFGEQITALKCAKCGTDNEFGGQICYYCGELLSGTRLSAPAAASQPTNIGQLVAVLAVLGVLILCVVVRFSGVLLSSTRPGQNYQPTASYKYVYVNRGATATVQAEATLAAGGVLPTSTPSRTPTSPPPTKTRIGTVIPSATYTPGTPRPTATPVPRPTPLHQGIAQRVGDLGELINFENKLDVVSQPFQGGMMLLRNEQLVYVLYNDSRWQPFGDDIFGSLADWRLLSWEQGAQLQHASARQFVGVWLHLGAANSELGLALKPSTPPAFPKTDEMVDYENGIIFISERLGQYILYNSGQWAQPGEASVGQPAPTPIPILPSPTPVNFSEEFDGANLDELVWVRVGPPAEVKDGTIHLKSNQATFPYIYAKQNLFPTQGNFVVEISFRYTNLTVSGAGLIIDKTTPPPETKLQKENVSNAFLSIFQDRGFWPLVIYFGGSGNRVFASSGPDLMQHTLELRYTGKYDVLLDDKLLYTSPPTDERPSSLWFGNPSNVGSAGEWSSFEIDYIRIRPTGEEAVAPSVPDQTTSDPVLPAPPANCSISTNPEIMALWGGQLGCPIDQQQVVEFGAEQAMQGGHLFWRKDTDGIYVIYDRNKQTGEDLMAGDWFPSDDKWNEVDSW